ncbi:tripartite tricarboxylate transporter substrate binding protein [Nitratireductor sp. ZSWI3]|uniref:Bug family tripartite tricarboxylate transporter substrate binding protein n=1 Tax=Nitratireductor sp. ZSWI3 TaxID=2966359 RepID=UPI00214F8662|nr:tripartite tricarboxylate transporter substrate binding protein [Nitratireductor sp. ZSWI3]MCR4265161.1 tripartite tricarboxylate transporter substrate binding protein [Nitratireductor sp. ZSWI3]
MKLNNLKKTLVGLASAAMLVLGGSGSVAAQDDWKPSGAVNFVLHTKPGGGVDVFTRTLAKSLEPLIGQSIVVVNAPGGGGATQMAKVRAAAPDGLTLGVNTVTHFTGMLTNLRGTFSPDDFEWIALAQEDPILFFVAKNSELDSITDLVELARANGGEVNIGGFGPVGSMQNIGMTMLEQQAGVKFNWVAFESTPDIIAAVLGGHVDVGVSNLGPALSFFEADRLKGLGVLGEKRLSTLPDMQTFGEQGYDVDTSWIQVRGVFGPKGMPLDLQKQIAHAIHTAMQADGYQKYARSAGVEDSDYGPVEYADFVQRLTRLAEEQLVAAGLVNN